MSLTTHRPTHHRAHRPTHRPPAAATASRLPGWRALLSACAWITLVATVVMQVAGRFVGFPSLVVLDAAMLLGLALLHRPGRAGVVVIGLFSLLNNLHAGLFVAALTMPEAPVLLLTSLATWVASVLAVPVAVLAWRQDASAVPERSARAGRLVLRGLLAGLVVVAAASLTLFATRTNDTPRTGDLLVAREQAGLGLLTEQAGRVWTPSTVEAAAGSLTVAVTNTDPVLPATFHVDELDVHLAVPPSTTRRVTFTAQPGSYRFHDETALVEGTLVVR